VVAGNGGKKVWEAFILAVGLIGARNLCTSHHLKEKIYTSSPKNIFTV
jgi:hypothetical protein